MKSRVCYCVLAALVTLALTLNIASAQTNSGEISGRVVDSSGAVVVGAAVTLTNQATGDTRATQTNKEGGFIFVSVQPGTFNVSAKAPGFRPLEMRDLKLSASERLSAGELKLEVGTVAEAVMVTAETTPVQTQSAERSALLDSRQISTLMSSGRDALSMTRLLPGVVLDGDGSDNLGTQNAGFVAGVRASSNAVSIDGVLGNPRGDGNKLDTPVSMDSIAEIKVILNSYQAEYGGSAGAIINLVTKSGGQQFHGSGYYYGRNEFFNANEWLNNYKGDPRERLRMNTIGYNVGGPLYIPKVFNKSKEKLFFFFSQEHWPTKGQTGQQRYMMPTLAERNGDFSKSYDVDGNKVYVKDPLLGLPCSATNQAGCFPGNIIPPGRINATTQAMLNIFPNPTIDCRPGKFGVGTCPLKSVTSGDPYNFEISGQTQSPAHQTLLRVDYNITDKWHLYFRGSKISKNNIGLTSTTNKHQWGIPSYYSTPSENAGFNLTFVASPTLVNEFTVGYASWKELNNFQNASGLEQLSKTALGLNLGQNNPDQNPLALVPRITAFNGGSGSGIFKLASTPEINFDNRFPMDNMTGTWEFTDGLTKIWNRHTLKAGVYFQASRYLQKHIGSIFSGNFTFTPNSSSPYDTQYAYSNMLVGSYNSYQEGSNVVDYAPHWNVLEWYLQDSWRVKSNLTMDYGLRFSYDLPTTLIPGMGASFALDRYDPSQVPALYTPVTYASLNAAGKAACKGLSTSNPSRCAQNPGNLTDIKPDAFIGTFVSPFNYTGIAINTDSTYPKALRESNGVLLAPRFGVSWDPFGTGKTAVRLGAGLYYNSREGAGTVGDFALIAPLVTNNSVGFGQITSTTFQPGCGGNNSCYGTATKVNDSPQATKLLQPDRKIESTMAVNFGIQRNVGFDTVVDVAYVGTFGRHLNQQINLNAIDYLAQLDPKYLDKTQTTGIVNGTTLDGNFTGSKTDFYYAAHHNGVVLHQAKLLNDNYFRPFLGYQNIDMRSYGATSNYNSLQVAVNRRFTKGLQFGVSYAWSKTMVYGESKSDGAVNWSVANFQDRRWWSYGLAQFDRTHSLVFHWTANLPKASHLWNHFLIKAIGDNWEYSGIGSFVSGQPLRVTMSGTPNLTGGGDGTRVLLLGEPYAPRGDVHTTLQWLNQDSFVMPPLGVVPTPDMPGITRNVAFRGPGTNNWDMALQKNIPITERVKLAIRAEAYNVFNHVSFTMGAANNSAITADFDSSTTCTGANATEPRCGSGLIKAGSTFGQVAGERGPRILQLSARITF
jgi:Carboxypeptidase regulatory-like domain